MPVYEYKCKTCEHTLRKLQKRQDPTPKICPGCEAEDTLYRTISSGSFHLKGGGWYDSGYASTAERQSGSESAESSSPESSSSESSSTESSSTESSSTESSSAKSSTETSTTSSCSGGSCSHD